MRVALTSGACCAAILATAAVCDAQVGGNLAKFPPKDVSVRISTTDDGQPELSVDEIKLVTGGYYRLNFECPDVVDDLRGWRIEMPDLLRSSHLRLVSVGDIEIHLQGLSFHAIECDEVGTARVSLVPIRPGTYDLHVGNVPLAIRRAAGQGKSAVVHVVVE